MDGAGYRAVGDTMTVMFSLWSDWLVVVVGSIWMNLDSSSTWSYVGGASPSKSVDPDVGPRWPSRPVLDSALTEVAGIGTAEPSSCETSPSVGEVRVCAVGETICDISSLTRRGKSKAAGS